MPKKTPNKRDGCYQRKDRGNTWWISWKDAQGRRRQRKTSAQNITQAKEILNAVKHEVEKAKALGVQPAGKDTFKEVSAKYLKYQKARLTPAAYAREEGIL